MDWGVVAGSAADSAVKTYTSIQENTRKNAEDARAELEAKRQQAAEERLVADRATNSAFDRAALAGGSSAQTNDAPAAPAAPAVPQQGGLKTRANLGAGDVAAANTPAADEGVEQQRALAAGASPTPTPTPAPAPTPRQATSPSQGTGGLRAGSLDAIRAAARANPSAYARDALAKAEAAAEISAERVDAHNLSTLQQRSVKQGIDVAERKETTFKASQLANKGAIMVDGFKDLPPTTPFAQLGDSGKEAITTLEDGFNHMPDGKNMSHTFGPNGEVIATVVDRRTGEKTTHTYKDLAALQELGRTAGVMADPLVAQQYSIAVMGDDLAKKLQPTQTAIKTREAENQLQALDIVHDNMALMKDPTSALKNEAQIRKNAAKAAILARDVVMQDAGTIEVTDPNTGVKTKQTVKKNLVLEMLENALPKQTATVVDDLGRKGELHIDVAIDRALAAHPEILKKVDYDPAMAAKLISDDLLAATFDPVVVEHAMGQIQSAVLKGHQKAAAPRSLQYPYSGNPYTGMSRQP